MNTTRVGQGCFKVGHNQTSARTRLLHSVRLLFRILAR